MVSGALVEIEGVFGRVAVVLAGSFVEETFLVEIELSSILLEEVDSFLEVEASFKVEISVLISSSEWDGAGNH